jgi:release factor glutamine methyltransferase
MARRIVHAMIYRFLVRGAIARVDTTHMFGFSIQVLPHVFHPRFYLTSRFLATYLNECDLNGKRVLEIGSGSGLLSLVAARRGAAVTAVDINAQAVECTILNAMRNHLDGAIRVIHSDLFDQVPKGAVFDYIIWNPPYYAKEPTDDASRAWYAGEGYSVIARFASSAGRSICANGRMIFVLSSEADVDAIVSQCVRNHFTATKVRSRSKFFETLMIYEFTPVVEHR